MTDIPARSSTKRGPARHLWWWLPSTRWRVVAQVDEADDVPAAIRPHGIVLVGLPGHLKWAAFDCACGTERILLNLVSHRWPAWTVTASLLHGITIHPSVDTHHHGRRCHYLIRAGRTIWVHRPPEGRV
jgi:Family of unknown function (DUF6527)